MAGRWCSSLVHLLRLETRGKEQRAGKREGQRGGWQKEQVLADVGFKLVSVRLFPLQ